MMFFIGGIAYGSENTFTIPADPPAQSNNGLQQGPGFGPPPEAYAACKNKKEGDRAQFTDRNGVTLTGTCQSDGSRLVLRPDRPKGDSGCRQHNPPPEAYKACVGKKAGDPATLIDPRGQTLHGTCEEIGGKLALRPDRPQGDQPPPGAESSQPSDNTVSPNNTHAVQQ